MAADDHQVTGGWRCSLLDLLVLMVVVGVTFKLWQAENRFGPDGPSLRWETIQREWGAYAVLATHGGLLILPSLWFLLGRQRLSISRGLLAIAATFVIAAFDCWLIPLLLNGRWEFPELTELWEFWLEYVWAPQLALVTVAFANSLTWRLLGWRLVRVQRSFPMDA